MACTLQAVHLQRAVASQNRSSGRQALSCRPAARVLAPPVQGGRSRALTVAPRAERSSDSGFLTGFVVGGVVFGALGFLFAPQISKALLNDDQRLRLPRFLEDETPKDPEATKQELMDKISQLNASIDEVAAQLKSKDDPATLDGVVATEVAAMNN